MVGNQAAPSDTSIASLSHSVQPTGAVHILTKVDCNFSTIPTIVNVLLSKTLCSNNRLRFSINRFSQSDFTLTWDARPGRGPLAKDSISAADLYWLEPETQNPIHVLSVVGALHPAWPTLGNDSLCLRLTSEDLDRTKLPSGETLKWRSPQKYLARLSFYSAKITADDLAVPGSSGLLAARNFSSHHLEPEPQDVKFVFKRGEEESHLWTTAAILRDNCPSTLFNSDFVEARSSSDNDRNKKRKLDNNVTTNEEAIGFELDDNDSDVDLDESLPGVSTATSASSHNRLHYQISIHNAAYSTYRVVLMYLQTGHVWFAPLTSSFSHLPVEARPKARLEAISAQYKLEPKLPPPASPKSVYKLAHYLSLPSLQSLALQEISRQLSIENVFIELFDGLPSVYDEVRKVMVEYAVKHKKEVIETEGFKTVMERLRRNELDRSGAVVADLLPLFMG